jgi:outer membrane biosynthesis protein TonB
MAGRPPSSGALTNYMHATGIAVADTAERDPEPIHKIPETPKAAPKPTPKPKPAPAPKAAPTPAPRPIFRPRPPADASPVATKAPVPGPPAPALPSGKFVPKKPLSEKKLTALAAARAKRKLGNIHKVDVGLLEKTMRRINAAINAEDARKSGFTLPQIARDIGRDSSLVRRWLAGIRVPGMAGLLALATWADRHLNDE